MIKALIRKTLRAFRRISRRLPRFYDFRLAARRLPRITAASKSASLPIPATIYRCFSRLYPTPRRFFNLAHRDWIRMNPEFTLLWYDDSAIRDELAASEIPDLLNAWDKLIPGAYRADLWRYFTLFSYGGIYLDAPFRPLLPLAEILEGCWNTESDQHFVSVKEQEKYPGAIYTGFLACSPRHPFMEGTLRRAIRNVMMGYYGENQLAPTGCLCLGDVIKEQLGLPEETGFSLGATVHGNLSFYLLELKVLPSIEHLGRRLDDNQAYILKNGSPVICLRYSQREYKYLKKRINPGQPWYGELWRRRNIYR